MAFDRNTKIAFLGMGLMGSRMATRLIQAGFEVAVWNRSAAACDELVAIGATPLSLDQIALYPVILSCLALHKCEPSHRGFFEPIGQSNIGFGRTSEN